MSGIDVGKNSIQRRIVRVFFATTGLVLLLTAGALFLTTFLHFQKLTNDNLMALVRIIGANTEASLLFDDHESATDTLRALAAEESIEVAIVYDRDGHIFAKYVRSDVIDFSPPSHTFAKPNWSRDHIDLTSELLMGDETIGTVFIRADTKEVSDFLSGAVLIVSAVLLISFCLCWIGATRLQNHIAAPLARLVDGSASMAEGDLSTHVYVQGDDEIGVLAHAFNAMVMSLRGLVARIGENTRYVAEATEQLETSSAEMKEEAARQAQAVELTAVSIERITSSVRTVNESVEALSNTAIGTSNAAIEMDASIVATSGLIDDLTEFTDETASGVVEMTAAIREIARSAETLNQSTVSTASALELLSDSVRKVESNALESHALSDETSQRAELGMAAVHETVRGMEEIQESFRGIDSIVSNLSEKSESIGAVVKVIQSVVEQTNLLALNAAIISSQAGEQGRAFSVVAEEVRSLAERTASSTRKIAELIESVQDGVLSAVSAMEHGASRVDRGVELSNQAGRILREIGESSQQSTRWAREIVEATRSQAADIDRVGIAMKLVKETATGLNRSTHEQDSASTAIMMGVERVLNLGIEVKNATAEQRRESRLITLSVEVVAERIREILVETQSQSKRSDQIHEALQIFREVTIQVTRRAAEAGETVGELSAHAQGLEEEIGRFRL